MNSTVVVACLSDRRWFDLDAVRTVNNPDRLTEPAMKNEAARNAGRGEQFRMANGRGDGEQNPAGAPPLDWWDANDPTPAPHTDRGNMTTTNTVTFHRGDVRDVMASMPDHSVDLLVTSPPFLALRSYLPADHVDKHREIGSEATPAAFLDTMLELSAVWRRLVTSTGSICVEIGDTYSGSGGAGGDYNDGGMRDGQARFNGAAAKARAHAEKTRTRNPDPAWPLAKSLCGIPTLYAWSLAYGRNLLTGESSPAGRWRIRNLLTWTRPNPPVGALGDKFRPATSFVTVACTSDRRWFDLDAVRDTLTDRAERETALGGVASGESYRADPGGNGYGPRIRRPAEGGGAPPLDWWQDDWQPLHRLPTAPYAGSHYAAYPIALPRRLIESMCPLAVCSVCGEARRRIVGDAEYITNGGKPARMDMNQERFAPGVRQFTGTGDNSAHRKAPTLGWTECRHAHCTHGPEASPHECPHYRPGVVFDPFCGSGTTAVAAALCGRDAVLIDLDARNVDLCRRRLTETMLIVNETTVGDVTTWTVRHDMPGTKTEHPDQQSLFADGAA